MSLDNALFLIDRGGQNFKVTGSTIGDKIKDGDAVLVQRGNTKFKSTYNNGFNSILDTDLLLARQGDANYRVTGAAFKELFSGPKVQITQWDWPTTTQKYGTYFNGYWTTKHARRLERDGYQIYANFAGDTTSGTDEWRFHPTTTGYYTITGKAYSKYDDSTDSKTARIHCTGYSINPSTITDYKNGMVGGSFRPKVIIPNEDTIYNLSGAEMYTTWTLVGLTPGNEEATFTSPDTSGQINETREREPRVALKKRTRNGPITLKCQVTNPDNFEYARPEVQFTIG